MKRNTNSIVKESNDMARAKIQPKVTSVWEERITALVVARIHRADNEIYTQSFSVAELTGTDAKRLSSSQHAEIRDAVRKLGRTTVETTDAIGRGLRVFPVFSSISIDDDGNVDAKINGELAHHYLNLRGNFALRSLSEFNALSSVYSQLIFKYLNSWKTCDSRFKIIQLDELQNILDTPKSFTKNFADFRIKILEPTHKEITQKTSLYYQWEPVKIGARKVIAIKFIFGEITDVKITKKQLVDPIIDLQKESNQCWEKHHLGGGECKPDKRKKRCKYCMERGRMAVKIQKENTTNCNTNYDHSPD